MIPFSQIYGQDAMKLGLILNIIDPKIGGILLFGDRGTGKSTAVRALQQMLPKLSFWSKKSFITSKSLPLVDLPLGATEDRLCGTIDIEKALRSGAKSFEPGLLFQANGGIIYVDEINLLDDHLVDLLLDSAASGWNRVERENISVRHPSNFLLIGSGNPEEGELRPQLLDRFGLNVSVTTPKSPALRARIVSELQSSNLSISKNKTLQNRIAKARGRKVSIPQSINSLISNICAELQIDGLRGDLVLNRTSRAFAAFCGRSAVTLHDLEIVLPFCLSHRLRKDPLDNMDSSGRILETFHRLQSVDSRDVV